MGNCQTGDLRAGLDRRLKLKFLGSQIIAAVTSGLAFDNGDGSVNLSGFSPFSADTKLTVRAEDGDIEFGVAAVANIVATPEPASAVLIGTGSVALVVFRRFCRRRI